MTLVAALLATSIVMSAGQAASSDTSLAGMDRSGVLMRQSRDTGPPEIFGFELGEERRYVLGPREALRRGETGTWGIRLDELYRPGTDAAEAVFVLVHEWHGPLVEEEVPYRWLDRVLSHGWVRVNAHGFPLLIHYETQRHRAGLGEEGYTIDYEYRDGYYEKRTSAVGTRWSEVVKIRSHEYLDKDIPAGLFVFLPKPPGCMDREVTGTDYFAPVPLPEPRSASTPPGPPTAALPATSLEIDNADCEESLFINPGLLNLAMPIFWESREDHEFLFFTPIGPIGRDSTDPALSYRGGRPGATGQPTPQPLPGSSGGFDERLRGEGMGTATYHETETLRFRGERVSIRRGQQTIEARKLEGPSRFAAIYVDDEGLIVRIDLPKLRDEEPQRWIRMLWPSEF